MITQALDGKKATLEKWMFKAWGHLWPWSHKQGSDGLMESKCGQMAEWAPLASR